MEVTRQFYEGCCQTAFLQRRLVLSRDMDEYANEAFLFNDDGTTLEIVVFKKTFRKIFEESHAKFEEFMAAGQVITDEKSLVEVYLMTVGMLLCTNENHSVINIHEDIVMRLLHCTRNNYSDLILLPKEFLKRELFFIETLLSSNINKINKSSSLWHYFKKLFIYVLDKNRFAEIPPYFFFKTAMAAAQLHPSNYYSWNFVTFSTNISKLRASCTFFIDVLKDVEAFCKAHLNDNAAWTCYTNIIEMNSAALKLACSEYNRYAESSKLEFHYQKVAVTIPSPRDRLMDFAAWLWKTNCVAEVPYSAFRRLLLYTVVVWQDRMLVRQLMEQVVVHCSLMEQVWLRKVGIDVVVKNGYFICGADLESDAVLKEKVMNYVQWKRLLNWHTEFVFNKYLKDTEDMSVA